MLKKNPRSPHHPCSTVFCLYLNMKTILLLFTIFITTNTKAQFATFAPIGAEMWIIEFNANGPPMAYYRFEVTNDTVIAGDSYNKLVRNKIQELWVMDTFINTIGYFKQIDGVITCYDTITNEELPYFNLNASLGDTISTPVYYGSPNPDYEKFRHMVVDSIGDTIISGVTLKKFWMEFLPYESIDEYAFFWNSNIFIEGIGFLGYPLQWYNPGAFDGDYPGELNCYEDSILGLVKFVDVECDYLITDIKENTQTQLAVYPNPSSDNVIVQLIQYVASINKVELVSINGSHTEMDYTVIDNKKITFKIDLLPVGIYTVLVYDKSNNLTTAQIIKL